MPKANIANETNEKTAHELLDDLQFIYASGVWDILGKRWIDRKRWEATIETLKDRLQFETQTANEILHMKDEMIAGTKSQCQQYIKEAEDYVESMDVVELAKKQAQSIIQAAQAEAASMIQEGEQVRDELIREGEQIRGRNISEGQEYTDRLLGGLMDVLREQATSVAESHNELQVTMQDYRGPQNQEHVS